MPSPVHPYSDYGVALRTLKSARSWLAWLLFVCVLAQFIGFAVMWWTPQPFEQMQARWKETPAVSTTWEEFRAWLSATTRPVAATAPGGAVSSGRLPLTPSEVFYPGTAQSRRLNIRNQWDTAYTMIVPVTQLAGLIAVSSQAIIIFVTLLVVLVAQAPGVAQTTRSFIWSVLLLFMYLPWQYFARDFPIPGVIYSYSELLKMIGPQVAGDRVYGFEIWLVYGRFIVWPIVGLFALLITSERYRAGVMIAIGHPLQSILQPRQGQGPIPPSAIPAQPRPLPTIPAAPAKKSRSDA